MKTAATQRNLIHYGGTNNTILVKHDESKDRKFQISVKCERLTCPDGAQWARGGRPAPSCAQADACTAETPRLTLGCRDRSAPPRACPEGNCRRRRRGNNEYLSRVSNAQKLSSVNHSHSLRCCNVERIDSRHHQVHTCITSKD